MNADLATVFANNVDRIVRRLQHSFPGMCASRCEDAAYAAYLDSLAKPAVFRDALTRGGESMLVGVYQQVAWRHLRGQWRKKSFQSEQAFDVVPELMGGTTPEALTSADELRVRVDALVHEAAAQFGGSRPELLEAALRDKLLGGEPDTRLAKRHDVPREYLNRAKRWLQDEVRAAA